MLTASIKAVFADVLYVALAPRASCITLALKFWGVFKDPFPRSIEDPKIHDHAYIRCTVLYNVP